MNAALDAGAFAPCTSPKTYTALAPGNREFKVRATDAAQNADPTPATFAWTIDTAAPSLAIDSLSKSLLGAGDSAELKWHGSENGAFALRVGGADCATGTVIDSGTYAGAPAPHTSNLSAASLAEGQNTLRLCLTDAAQNAAAVTTTAAKDTIAPQTQIDTHPADPTNLTAASFAFSGTDPSGSGLGGFECALDAGAFAPCTSPKTYTALAPGNREFKVRATDAAHNADPSPATFAWTIDTAAPSLAIDSLSKSLLGAGDSAELKWHGSENGAFALRVGGADCATGTVIDSGTYAGAPAPHTSNLSAASLAEGQNTLRLCLTDAAQNAAAATTTAAKDTIAPQTQIDTHPADPTNLTSASFAFSGTDPSGSGLGGFECALDAGAFAPCTSPKTYTALAPGNHEFKVRATDAAQNADPSPATFAWTIDTAAPSLAIDSLSKSLLGAGDSAELKWHGSENGAFALRVGGADCATGTVIDSGTYAGAPAPHTSNLSAASLAEGQNTLRLCLTDAAQNAAAATTTAAKDTIAPQTQIDTHPADPTNLTSASFAFSGTDPSGSGLGGFECALDAGAFAPCTSPKTYTALAPGNREFKVRATDAAQNADPTPATFAWTIDTAAPSLAIDSLSKSLLGAGDSAELKWHGSENGAFALRVGGADCATGTVIDSGTYAGAPAPHTSNLSAASLAEGQNTLRLCLTDAAQNAAAVTTTAAKDTIAPQTQIDTHPADPTNLTAASFAFSGTDPSGSGLGGFECALDAGAFAPCTSPKTYTALAPGNREFKVRATDAAQNADPIPGDLRLDDRHRRAEPRDRLALKEPARRRRLSRTQMARL